MFRNRVAPVFVVINLFIVDLLAANYIYNSFANIQSKGAVTKTITIEENKNTSNGCGEECQKYIDKKINETSLNATSSSTIDQPPVIQTVSVLPTRTKSRSVNFLPILGSGSTLATDWTDISGTDFYLDVKDYPGLIEAYLEVNIKLVNGNGKAFIRLFDSTHSIAVVGSEVKTNSQASVLVVSDKLNLWAGKNLYRIQAKSLTTDTTVFENGRIKIVTEN